MFRAITAVAGLLTVLAIVGVLGFVIAWLSGLQKTAVKAQEAAGRATVAAGQAQTAQSAQRVIVQGQTRDRLDIQVHQANAAAIAVAPGASQALDPALDRIGIDGLCQHEAYAANPRCARLRRPNSTVLPPTGSTDTPPT